MRTVEPADLTADRSVLFGHCYRMLGSPFDADDAVQETYIRAVKGLDRFEARSSVRTWLTTIATRVCLDELRRRKHQRIHPTARESGTADAPFDFGPPEEWVEPVPDHAVLGHTDSPEDLYASRQSIRLAFVAALQQLPPRQRAALLLTDVMGCSAAEVARALDTSAASIYSATQRARAVVPVPTPAESCSSLEDAAAIDRYVAAFTAWDVDALTALLAQDVQFAMPPIRLWLRGPEEVHAFLRGRGGACEGSTLVPVTANGQPAFAQYKATGDAWGLLLLRAAGGKLTAVDTFLDVERLFPLFEVPLHRHASE